MDIVDGVGFWSTTAGEEIIVSEIDGGMTMTLRPLLGVLLWLMTLLKIQSR